MTCKRAGYVVILVVNANALGDPGDNDATIQIVRENRGFDFAAWGLALHLFPGIQGARSVTFTNDSLIPVDDGRAAAVQREKIQRNGSDVVFLTKNNEIKPHFQSYFFTVKRGAASGNALTFLASLPEYNRKRLLIQKVEVELGSEFSRIGLSVDYLYKLILTEGAEKNPTIHHWDELVADGFPFIKAQLIASGAVPISDPQLVQCLSQAVLPELEGYVRARAEAPSAGRSGASLAGTS